MKINTNIIVSKLLNKYNVDLSVFEDSYIIKTVTKEMESMNSISLDSFLEELCSDENKFMKFYNTFFNGYSSFFRERMIFSYLQFSLPNKISSNNEIRIWSAGCSNGQEPYSLAILLEELKIDFDMNFKYIIFATDTSESALSNAKDGRYRLSDLENLTIKEISKYFVKEGNSYRIKDEIRNHISFTNFDLIGPEKYPKDSIFGDFDIVMCSNVLIYYNEKVQQDIIDKLYKSIKDEGYLITSSSEIEYIEKTTKLDRTNIGIPIIQKKDR